MLARLALAAQPLSHGLSATQPKGDVGCIGGLQGERSRLAGQRERPVDRSVALLWGALQPLQDLQWPGNMVW